METIRDLFLNSHMIVLLTCALSPLPCFPYMLCARDELIQLALLPSRAIFHICWVLGRRSLSLSPTPCAERWLVTDYTEIIRDPPHIGLARHLIRCRIFPSGEVSRSQNSSSMIFQNPLLDSPQWRRYSSPVRFTTGQRSFYNPVDPFKAGD